MTIVKQIIKIDEESGHFKPFAYYDTKGIPTQGWGFRVGNPGDPLPTKAMTLEEGEKRLDLRINEIAARFERAPFRSFIRALNPVRRAVLVSMAYQLGITGLLGFTNLIKALDRLDFDAAAAEIMDSKAAREDAPKRFARNAIMMRTGKITGYYN